MDNIQAGGKQFVYCREVVPSSECPLSEVPLYTQVHTHSTIRINTALVQPVLVCG